MDVAARAVDEIAEQSRTAEVERQHLDFAVAAVLQLHANLLRPFARLHELPALVDRERGGNFDERVAVAVHRLQCDRHVRLPVGYDVADVDAALVEHLAVGVLAEEPELRLGMLVLPQPLLRGGDAPLVQVGDGDDLHARHNREPLQRPQAAVAKSGESESDLLHRRQLEPLHRRARLRRPQHAVKLAARQKRRRAHPGRSLQNLASCLHRFTLRQLYMTPY